MKRLIYVDFENVSTSGLTGLLKLDAKDHVKIFLGPKCSKFSLIEADTILHCNAAVELITNDQIAKNALDFIIMVHLGYDIAKKAAKAYYIISNDKGYEPAIKEMQSMTGEHIFRLPDIAEVIGRNDVPGGLFGGLFAKKAVVENATEHEVIERGKSKKTGANGKKPSGNGPKNDNRSNDRNNRNNGKPNAPKNAPKNTSDNRKNPKNTKPVKTETRPNPKNHTVSRSTNEPRPVKPLVEEEEMDNLSVSELVKEMDKAPVKKKENASQAPKKQEAEHAPEHTPAPLNEEERTMVERIIGESKTKEEFHNNLMSTMRENDRATDIYKMERAHFNRVVKEREQAEKAAAAKTGNETLEKPETQTFVKTGETAETVLTTEE